MKGRLPVRVLQVRIRAGIYPAGATRQAQAPLGGAFQGQQAPAMFYNLLWHTWRWLTALNTVAMALNRLTALEPLLGGPCRRRGAVGWPSPPRLPGWGQHLWGMQQQGQDSGTWGWNTPTHHPASTPAGLPPPTYRTAGLVTTPRSPSDSRSLTTSK